MASKSSNEQNKNDSAKADCRESSIFSPLPDSDDYIRKLESKLSRVKGCHKELVSKDMISSLQKARDDHMSHMISGAESKYLSDVDAEKEIATSYLERKLFPEKSGVTYEEMQRLVESDILAKVSTELNAENVTENSVDR